MLPVAYEPLVHFQKVAKLSLSVSVTLVDLI